MNTIRWRQRLAHLRGSPVAFDLRPYDQELAEINRLGIDVGQLSDGELETRARALRLRAVDSLESIRAEFFALAREASRRAIGLWPFDVQVRAALALDCGHIVEMQTGEGKTLAAVMPAALRALAGRGAHVLTFNDYLARRDAEWMGPVYAMLGLSVGFVQQGMTPEDRRRAYLADVTYVTAKEAGFDHMRDLLAMDRQALVHQHRVRVRVHARPVRAAMALARGQGDGQRTQWLQVDAWAGVEDAEDGAHGGFLWVFPRAK